MSFYKITANGKSIGVVRTFEELKVQKSRYGAKCFFVKLNYQKKWNEKAIATESSIQEFSPEF